MHIAIDQAVNIDTGAGLALAQLLEEIFMKLQLNKLMAGLVMAGSVVALVGCGDGDEPTLVVTEDSPLQITKAVVADTKTLVEAGSGAVFEMPSAISFENVTGGAPGTTSTAPVITLTQTTDAATDAIADFVMTDGDDEIEGTVDAGSCVFRVKKSKKGRFIVGQKYRISSCLLKTVTKGTAVGASTQAALQLVLNNAVSKTTDKKITVTIVQGTGNTASVVVNGKTVGSIKLPTGTVVR